LEFDILRRDGVAGRGQFVNLAAEPINLGFEDTNPAENERVFVFVAGRLRVVQIEEMHVEKRKAAKWVCTQRTAKQPSQPHF
jgi:hypothetical protein